MLVYDVVEEIPASSVNSGSRLVLVEYTPTDEEVANILYDTSAYDNSDRNSPPARTGGTGATGGTGGTRPAQTGGTGATGGTAATGGTGGVPLTRTATVNGVTYTINTQGTEQQSDDTIVIDGVTYDANSYISNKEEDARRDAILNNGSADGSTGESVDNRNLNPQVNKKVETVEPCIEKGESGGSGATGGTQTGSTGGTTTQEDTTPINPRVVKRGKYGTLKSSTKNKNAPLIFVVGGIAVGDVSPGDADAKREGYMWTGTGSAKSGYNDLQDFNIYNCFTSQSSKNGWGECKKILDEQKIKPSKYILVIYSAGVAGGHSGVLTVKTADTWDQIHISGPPLGDFGVNEKTFKKYIETINKAGKEKVYYWAVGTGNAEGAARTDWKKQIIDALPASNVNTKVANHFEQIETVSQGIKNNNPVEEGKKAEVVVTEPKKPEPICDDLEKVDAKKKANESPEKGAEVVTENRQTSDGQSKESDAKPPSKNIEPVYSGKLNHRFYQYPIETNTKPATLQEMLDSKKPWYKRYWAWRSSDAPGHGLPENESLLAAADGTPLVTSLIPYWPPPENDGVPDGTKQLFKPKPSVSGEWKSLSSAYKKITSVFDIPIILNSPDVGLFNNKIGYLFEQGNELHMTISSGKILHNKGKGVGIGLGTNTNIENKPDSNWGGWSRWDGYFAKHCLDINGFNSHPDIENVNKYHENLIKSGKLANYPGNKQWKPDEMLAEVSQNSVIKPSKLWFNYLNEEELLKDKADCAIFVVDYHINKNGTLTDAGKKLLSHILNKLKWKMATISTVSYHNMTDNICRVDVLPYMDSSGNIITIAGQVNSNKPDPSMAQNATISVKKQSLYDVAKISGDSWVNGSIFVTNMKKLPKGDFREGDNLESKLYESEIIKLYSERIGKTNEQLNSVLYDNIKDILAKEPDPPPQPDPPISGNQSKDAADGNLPFTLRGGKAYVRCQPCTSNDIGGGATSVFTGQGIYTIGGSFPDTGGEAGIWDPVGQQCEDYLRGTGQPELSATKVSSMGGMTTAWRGTYTMGPTRACGSKHSAGLANDYKFKITGLKPNPTAGAGTGDNPSLMISSTYMKAMLMFVSKYGFGWGGTWSNQTADIATQPWGISLQGLKNAKGKTIVTDSSEIHHLEVKGADTKRFFSPYRNSIKSKYNKDYTTLKDPRDIVEIYELGLGPEANYLAWTQGFSQFRSGCRRPKTQQNWNGKIGSAEKSLGTGTDKTNKSGC